MKRRTLLGLLATPLLGLLPRPTQPLKAEPPWMFWPTDGQWRFYVTTTPTYEFWFTGYQPGDEQRIVGQMRYVAELVKAPRLTRQIYGISE